jgi:long-chain acyl-CoA synthetase
MDTWDRHAATSVAQLFLRRVRMHGDRSALQLPDDDSCRTISWRDLAGQVRALAVTLQDLGVAAGHRVVQYAENRLEWIVADLALHLLRAIHVPVHAPLSGEQVAEQLVDCQARLALVSGPELVDRLVRAEDCLPRDVTYLTYDPIDARIGRRPVTWLPSILAEDPGPGSPVEETGWSAAQLESVATILYTSGTTGEPKGVVLNQRNLLSNALAMVSALAISEADARLAFLPLSHSFARTCDLYTWLASGCELGLARSRQSVLQDCQVIRPTILSGVPYFFQQVQRRLLATPAGDEPGALGRLLGGRIRICCCGGAPLPDGVYDYFQQRGVPLLPGYGLTEASPVITASTPTDHRRGSVGKAIAGVEIGIAEDGEILTRGPHVMEGYWQKPEHTQESLRGGWLHTGDLGFLDVDRFLFITGRKKELLVTSGGKNVAPLVLESLLLEDPLIAQAMVVGDNRSFLAALIVPDQAGLAAELGWEGTRRDSGILDRAEARELFRARIAERMATRSAHEQLRAFCLLDRPFSLEQGELTPKLSLRREVIARHFAGNIERMYRAGPESSRGSSPSRPESGTG